MKALRSSVSCFLLVSLLFVGLFSGCSGGVQSDETNGPGGGIAEPTSPDTQAGVETEDPYEKDSLPDDLDFGGLTLRIGLYDSDPQVAAVAPEEEIGDLLNDAVYQRNARVMDRLNAQIETSVHSCGWADYRQYVLNTVTADTGDFDAWYLWQYDFANTITKGYWQDLQDAPYLDFSKPWWAADYMKEMSVDGRSKFFLLGDISYGFFYYSDCVFFNKDLVGQYGIAADDIYQTVLEGKWTFDSLGEIAQKIYTDTDGNGKVNIGDKAAFGVGPTNAPEHFLFDADNRFSYRGEDGYPVLDPLNEKIVNTIDRIIALYRMPTSVHYTDEVGDEEAVKVWREDFARGNTAFHYEQIYYMEYWREMEDDYGVIPFPKYDEEQKTYLSLIHDVAFMYGIPADCRNAEPVCALMEALAADSYRNVMPIYYSQVLKDKYARDTVSGQIIDIIHDHPVADFAYINGFGFNTVVRNVCNSGGDNTYVSGIQKILKVKQKELDKMIKAVGNNG